MTHPTARQTRAFWERMTRHYRTRVIHKRDALEMRLTARLLDTLNILERDAFLDRYTTVWGRRIYACFAPGEGDALWAQILVCTHEHRHVEQLQELGWARFHARYLGSARARALLEADAYATNIELHHWRHGVLPALKPYADVLRDYACDESCRSAALEVYEALGAALENGVPPSRPASQRAIALLQELGVSPETKSLR